VTKPAPVPDAPREWAPKQRPHVRLRVPRRRFATPDGALAWAALCPPLGGKGLDTSAVRVFVQDFHTFEEAVEVYSEIHAMLGAMRGWERWAVVRYALMRFERTGGYGLLAKESKARGGPGRKATVMLLHRRAREHVVTRLRELDRL
jgi:hypothetical protein